MISVVNLFLFQKFIFYISLVLLPGCFFSKPPALIEFQGKTMGTYYQLKIVNNNQWEETRITRFQNEVQQLLDYQNQLFSTYIEDSKLMQVNRLKAGTVEIIDSELFYVLKLAQEIAEKTDNYFDVTIGPVVNLWGFGPDREKSRPSTEMITQAMKGVGIHLFELDEAKQSFKRKTDKLFIDLSAIAKGYAVDRLFLFAKEYGFKNIMVEIGGEVRASGKNLSGQWWQIGIEQPSELLSGKIAKIIGLKNLAIATSGGYRNYVKWGDEVFSHTIDPKTGFPVQHQLVSVTVFHEQCVFADAYATALMAMGPERALKRAEELELMAFFMVKNEEGIELLSTVQFQKYLAKGP
jgi:thiamine biosynthesis lipoprotein